MMAQLAPPLRIRPKVARRKNKKDERKGKTKPEVRGKEITVHSSDPEHQVIYGTVRVGGQYTFVEAGGPRVSKASLLTGTGDSGILWTARAAGTAGNEITITMTPQAGATTTTASLLGNDVTVLLSASSGGAITATATEAILAARAVPEINSLLQLARRGGDGSGVVEAVDTKNLSDGGGTWLHQVVTLAGHQIIDVDRMYVGADEIVFGALPDGRWAIRGLRPDGSINTLYLKRVFLAINYGTDTQDAQPDLVHQLPDRWTTYHRQLGCAHVYVILIWNQALFPEGLPDLSFLVRGKPVHDPRTNGFGYSNNAALVIADFLMDARHGFGASAGDIDVDSWWFAADICDEDVALSGGGTEKRYTINGAFDSNQDPQDALEEMCAAMAGSVVYQAGKWFIYPGYWRVPELLLTDSDLRGDVQITTGVSRRDNFNTVKGKFISPKDKYEPTEFPPVVNSFYLSEDGEELIEDLTFNFVTSSAAAQRLAKIELERIRQGITVQIVVGLRGLELQVSDTIFLTLSRYGWDNKVFEVSEIEINCDSEDGTLVHLLLHETAEAVFDWNSGEETTKDLAPNSALPNPFIVAPPTGLTLTSGTDDLYLRADGTVFTRLHVSWTEPDDPFVLEGGAIEVQYKRSEHLAWWGATDVPGSLAETYILDVEDGASYDVRIRGRSAIGGLSDYVAVLSHTVVGKTAPPSDVSVFRGLIEDFGIRLEWAPIPDKDLDHYEVRQGDTWDGSTFLAEIRGTTYRFETKAAGSYVFQIKAVDTSKNESELSADVALSIAAPSPVISSYRVEGPDVVLSWNVSTGQFAIREYLISYGSTYAGSVELARSRTTSHRIKGTWNGSRRFWVSPVDIAGNIGSPFQLDVLIVSPGQVPSLGSEVVDNNIMLRWTVPMSGTLPIAEYRLSKGNTFSGSLSLGSITGTFKTFFESVSGTYTYWVVPIDTAGNVGVERSITDEIAQPPDFLLQLDELLDPTFAEVLFNVIVEGELYRPAPSPGSPIGGLLLGVTYAT